MNPKPNFEYYRAFLQAGADTLESYLLSKELFWPLGIPSPPGQTYPMLTLGELLLFSRCASALARVEGQETAYHKLQTQLDAQRTRWRVAWGQKASWEYKSRLRQWGESINEIRRDPAENAPYYRTEARLRTFLQVIEPDVIGLDPAHSEHLHSLDLILQSLLEPGDFIWHPDVSSAFPRDEFWFLWGLPRQTA